MHDHAARDPHQPAPRLHAAMDQVENLIDFRHIYHLLLNRWWIIALVVGFALLATIGYLFTATPIYESRAVLQVQQREHNVAGSTQVREDDPAALDFVNSVVQALTSRNIMLRVIESNNLRKNETFAPPRDRRYEDIELANLLAAKITVQLRRNTRLIDITVEDPDPVLARDLAGSVVREFLRENFSQRLSVSQVANDFLQEEADKLKVRLEASERKLQAYKEKNKAVSLDERQDIIVERLRDINTRVTEANSERIRLQSDIDQVKEVGPDNAEELLRIGSVAQIPQVAEARRQLLEAETELAGLQDRYLHKHPKHQAGVNKIASLRQALSENLAKSGQILQRQYEAAQQTEGRLMEALQKQEESALDLNSLAIPFNVLQREVESDRAMYESVILRLRETAVSGGVESAPYTLIEEPMVATKPSKPRKLLILAVMTVLSGMLAVGGIVVYDSMDTSLRSIDDAESALELSSLAGIPDHRPAGFARFRQVVAREKDVLPERLEKAKTLAAKKRGGGAVGAADLQDLVKPVPDDRTEKERYPIATIDDPSSALAESYRTLRANLAMLGPEDTRRILLFVSAIPEEGKTYTSLNTAVVLAQQGHRTLVVDVDLRRPTMHKALLPAGAPPPGLTDVFTGNAKLDDVIRPTGIENLFFLSAGSRAPNPAELLGSADVAALVAALGEKFDRVIFDSAPVNAVSDTLGIAPHVHKTILVVRAGQTPRKAVNRALMLLRKSGAKVAGFVLNRLPTGRTAGYYYYYYGDKYEKDSAYGGKQTAA